jgi:hypothetical protein
MAILAIADDRVEVALQPEPDLLEPRQAEELIESP